jgi:hypothetical protein
MARVLGTMTAKEISLVLRRLASRIQREPGLEQLLAPP